ncbi:hypothetical protein ACFC18_37575 [Streptomyces sp. NPDC056121]|uniref:hypothetical protein n=1 Tax=Streptomyces sp. NPDC056121 TaxID=3345718 RepID=UPI0035DC4EAF
MAHLESADRSVLLALGREPSFAPRIEQDQELVSAEINFCRYWLQHCGLGAWALHLSQHPEDTRLVVSSIQKDQFALIEYELELIAEDSPEDFQKAESARALLPAANDLIERPPPAPAPAPAGQGAVPGHPYAPPTSGTPYIPQQAPGAPYGPPCTAAGPTPAAPPGFRLGRAGPGAGHTGAPLMPHPNPPSSSAPAPASGCSVDRGRGPGAVPVRAAPHRTPPTAPAPGPQANRCATSATSDKP